MCKPVDQQANIHQTGKQESNQRDKNKLYAIQGAPEPVKETGHVRAMRFNRHLCEPAAR